MRALSVSASSWLCSAMTPAPQQLARSRVDQLDPELLGDQRHRAVQLRREAARDAAGPVGDFDLLAHCEASSLVGRGGLLDGVLGLELGQLALVALDVQVEFLVVLLGVLVDRLDLVLGVAGQLVVDAGDQLRQRAHLAGFDPADRGRQRAEHFLDRPFARFQLAFDAGREGLLQQQGLVQGALLLDDLDEGHLVVVAAVGVFDPLFAGLAAQAHDLVHRRHVLGAGVDAAEAVGAVVDPVRVVGQVVQALVGLGVARVADEAVGLGQRRRADEVGVGFHREAGGDAGAALDAGHRLGDVDHRFRLDDVLALGRLAVREEPGGDAADLGPVGRLHVGDQVLDHRHVAHRLDHDRGVVDAAPPTALAILSASSCASPIWVLQPSPDWPLIFIPQEPQIAARQEQRTASEPSSRSFACSRPSRTESEGSRSTLNSSQ